MPICLCLLRAAIATSVRIKSELEMNAGGGHFVLSYEAGVSFTRATVNAQTVLGRDLASCSASSESE